MPTILTDPDTTALVARRLLAAAGADPSRVEISTAGARVAFQVDDDLARAAGFLDADETPTTPAQDAPLADEPPRSGQGATVEAWRVWLAQHGLPVDEDSTRKELIAQWDSHLTGTG